MEKSDTVFPTERKEIMETYVACVKESYVARKNKGLVKKEKKTLQKFAEKKRKTTFAARKNMRLEHRFFPKGTVSRDGYLF